MLLYLCSTNVQDNLLQFRRTWSNLRSAFDKVHFTSIQNAYRESYYDHTYTNKSIFKSF